MNDWELDLSFLTERGENGMAEPSSIEEAYDNFFYEMANDEKAVQTKMARMVEHILKLAYCSSENDFLRDLHGWTNSIEKQKADIEKLSKHFKDKKILRFIRISLDSAYSQGLGFYEDAMSKNPSLEENYDFIPKENPWDEESFVEFLKIEDSGIGDMIDVLPYHTEFYDKYALED